MDELRVFSLRAGPGRRATPRPFRTEAELRRLVVRHASTLLNLTILATEYPIASDGAGRIDALGIDDHHRPVVLEFKRAATGGAICQALYYLDWLVSHRDVFACLVMDHLGASSARRIDWSAPRLLCIAEEVSEREEAVARQIGRQVELLGLRRLPGGLLLLQRPRTAA
ncbi:MAG: hypothetical protein M3Q03_00115 [Chloroflexota bacterium]|nr:hypothetical protein [Chloroflexota bacterium]